jgi:hypothetical protein
MCLDNVTLPARLVTRNRLRPRHHGLIPVHLVKCLFLLSPPFLCVAYSCAVVDKKDHTTGAIHLKYLFVSEGRQPSPSVFSPSLFLYDIIDHSTILLIKFARAP